MARVKIVLVMDASNGGEKQIELDIQSPVRLRELLASAQLKADETGIVLGPDGPVDYDKKVPPPHELIVLPPLVAG